MGTFVTNDEVLFTDKEAAPGSAAALPSGWTQAHVNTAANMNDLRDACYDLRTYAKAIAAAPTLIAMGSAAANWTKAGGDEAPRYWLDGIGMVHGMGRLTATGAASLLFFDPGFPAGYRPLGPRVGVGSYTRAATGAITAVPIRVIDDGGIFVDSDSLTPAVGDELVFSISFLAEQ